MNKLHNCVMSEYIRAEHCRVCINLQIFVLQPREDMLGFGFLHILLLSSNYITLVVSVFRLDLAPGELAFVLTLIAAHAVACPLALILFNSDFKKSAGERLPVNLLWWKFGIGVELNSPVREAGPAVVDNRYPSVRELPHCPIPLTRVLLAAVLLTTIRINLACLSMQ